MEDSIYILAKSVNSSVTFKIMVIKNELKLINNQSLERNITSSSPMTILVDQNFFTDKSSQVLMLTVDDVDNKTGEVCMMISVQVRIIVTKYVDGLDHEPFLYFYVSLHILGFTLKD
jgi:hypothetical protein